MAINKKLIHFAHKADFTTQLNQGNILTTSIVFILDTHEIFTHGQYYHCPYTAEEIQQLIEDKSTLKLTLAIPLDKRVVKISGITGDLLISLRGSNSNRTALTWISTYNEGSASRVNTRIIYNKDSYYEFYINGASDTTGTVYVKALSDNGYDNITVTALTSNFPSIELITSVPSDATLLNTYANKLATLTDNVASASKLGTSTVGNINQPIYLNKGVPTLANKMLQVLTLTQSDYNALTTKDSNTFYITK